jgi:hypothetical protein
MSLLSSLRERYSRTLIVEVKSSDLETAFIKLFLKDIDYDFKRAKASVAPETYKGQTVTQVKLT